VYLKLANPRMISAYNVSFFSLYGQFYFIILIGLLIILPVMAICLLNFSNRLKEGSETQSAVTVSSGLNAMKIYFIMAAVLALGSLLYQGFIFFQILSF
jgi:uncharacterized membrane protein